MKIFVKVVRAAVVLSVVGVLFSFERHPTAATPHGFPWKAGGFTERQAAAHLLSRFTFGARPGDVDSVLNIGLENWFNQQLDGNLPDYNLDQRLSGYDALKLSNTEVADIFPKPAKVLRMAVKEGLIDKDSVNKADKAAYRSKLLAYMQSKGMRPQKELFRQFINQKILRAAYSSNQLHELLTDFWFNHFNVSLTKNDCAEFIPAYERDAIRPNVTGKFEDLLLATAKSPAMLLYLDNFSSAGENTDMDMQGNGAFGKRLAARLQANGQDSTSAIMNKLKQGKKAKGINENYAREVMELHTLGVDGGYTQQDVTQAARVLTGWTIYPFSDYSQGNGVRKIIDRIGEDKLQQRGFVHDSDFLFAANRHDNSEKTVLGKSFSNQGYSEGVQLLKMLANHPSTAMFISRKLAVRFVSDNPPQTLVTKMAKTFSDTRGDIKQVLLTMVSSPEFWSKEAIRQKTKSPFELAISAVRSLNGDIKMPYQLFTWIDKMGQKIYYYQAPTGFPDNGQYWINTGSLLNRMNFGLALASQRIPGVRINLLALNNGHEPESAEAALSTFGKIVLPERDLSQTISRLTPLLHDPRLEKKIDQAAGKTDLSKPAPNTGEDVLTDDKNATKGMEAKAAVAPTPDNTNMMAQVVGIIIGSPEFQRK